MLWEGRGRLGEGENFFAQARHAHLAPSTLHPKTLARPGETCFSVLESGCDQKLFTNNLENMHAHLPIIAHACFSFPQ